MESKLKLEARTKNTYYWPFKRNAEQQKNTYKKSFNNCMP